VTDKPLPPGWHPMNEMPAPGKSLLFLFEIPGEGRKAGEASTMTAVVEDRNAPGGYGAVTLTPIAWRYR